MKSLSLFFLVIIAINGFSQNINLKVVDIYQSKCEQAQAHCQLQPRIVKQFLIKDTLVTTIGVIENCSGISEVKATINKDTIHFTYVIGKRKYDTLPNGTIRITKSAARCNCCFEFTFRTLSLNYLPKTTTINDSVISPYPDKYKIFPIQFDLIKNDTFNYIDKYGRKQGKWLIPDENFDYEPSIDSIYFSGIYQDGNLFHCEFRRYYINGILAQIHTQTSVREFSITDFYETGTISSQWIEHKSGASIFQEFYLNKQLKTSLIESDSFREFLEFFENGSLKKIKNNFSEREYYSNGALKKEVLYGKQPDKIWAKYYYSNGKIMALQYKKHKHDKETIKWKCFDQNGQRIPRDILVQKGYLVS